MTNIFEKKSNNQIMNDLNELRLKHDSIKQHILKLMDELTIIEEQYDMGHKEINKRLNNP